MTWSSNVAVLRRRRPERRPGRVDLGHGPIGGRLRSRQTFAAVAPAVRTAPALGGQLRVVVVVVVVLLVLLLLLLGRRVLVLVVVVVLLLLVVVVVVVEGVDVVDAAVDVLDVAMVDGHVAVVEPRVAAQRVVLQVVQVVAHLRRGRVAARHRFGGVAGVEFGGAGRRGRQRFGRVGRRGQLQVLVQVVRRLVVVV